MPPSPDAAALAREFAAALDWWRDAGVDVLYGDASADWLAVPDMSASDATARSGEPAVKPPPKSVRKAPLDDVARLPETIGGLPENWPRTLSGFSDWWRAEKSLEIGGTGPRIAPRGRGGADLMVIVPEPLPTDSDSLLSGKPGTFLDTMGRAMGVDSLYLASALPRHTPMADWDALAAAGLGKVLAHHVRLADPKRVMIAGASILPLLGHDPAQAPASLQKLNHDGGEVSAMAVHDIALLLRSAKARAMMWRRWLEWTDGTS